MAVAPERGSDPAGLIVRPPAVGDIAALEAIERRSFPDPWPGAVFLGELAAPGRYHRVLTTPEGELVAYLFAAWQYLDLHVLNIATHPERRRRGYARRLLDLALAHARGRGGESVTLEVRASNTGAIALYAAMGFEIVGSRPRYYGDGEDALVMTRALGAV